MRLFSMESPIESCQMDGRKRRRPVQTPRARCGGLERDRLVGIAAGARRTRRLSAGGPLAIAPAVEEGQHTVERREVDLGAVAVRARLVLPLAGGQLALEVDFRAFPQVALGDFAEALIENHQAVPLGAFAKLATAVVLPTL